MPEAQEHFLTPSARRDTHPFGGLGVRHGRVALVNVGPFFARNRDECWLGGGCFPTGAFSRLGDDLLEQEVRLSVDDDGYFDGNSGRHYSGGAGAGDGYSEQSEFVEVREVWDVLIEPVEF